MAKRKIKVDKGKRKKKSSIALLLSIISFLTIVVTFLILYFFFKPQQVVKYQMTLIVGDHGGFDLNRTAITFGMIMPSGSSMRHLEIKNSEQKKKVIIKATGDLARWVSVSNNNFMLKPYEVKFIDIAATVSSNAKYGNYTGTLIINFLRKK